MEIAATSNGVSASSSSVKNILLVLSGKGGVGKSMTASRLAAALHRRNEAWKIGVLDVDLCGPSVPRIFGVAGNDVHNCSEVSVGNDG